MSQSLSAEVNQFARSYASLFSSPRACSVEHVGPLCVQISKFYRPGVTFFTEGHISRFESRPQAASLIETEMRNNITSGLGTKLIMEGIEVTEYSNLAAVAWISWTFHPGESSEYAGKTWHFTNIYGYRVSRGEESAGWEYVVRDQEVSEMRKVVGKAFNE